MNNRTWQPTVKQIDRECQILTSLYFEKNPDEKMPDDYDLFLRDCAKIIIFLRNTNLIKELLSKLDLVLINEANNRKVELKERENGYLPHKKTLRETLEKELAKFDFQPDFAKALGLLPSEIFLSCIAEGYILKDMGVSTFHGEFTHALQWLLIAWHQQETQFLSQPIIDIYKKIGRSNFLWDCIIDQPFDVKNCQSPEYLNSILQNVGLFALNKLCNHRVAKREQEEMLKLEQLINIEIERLEKLKQEDIISQDDEESLEILLGKKEDLALEREFLFGETTLGFFQHKQQYPNKNYQVSDKHEKLLLPAGKI